MSRCVVVVLDSGGIGALPDAAAYGDQAIANTIGNTSRRVGGLALPNFGRLGLGNLTPVAGVSPVSSPAAYVARLAETSKGKDTITGHWEMAGIHTEVPFPTYPAGFPEAIVREFTAICGKAPLGNLPASGTEIIFWTGWPSATFQFTRSEKSATSSAVGASPLQCASLTTKIRCSARWTFCETLSLVFSS